MPPSGHNTRRKSFRKNSEKILFGYIIFGENFSRKIFAPQYPLASARGTQRSLNAPIGPQHEEKKFSENFEKILFGYIIFGENFSRKNFAPQYPLASARGTQRSLNAPIGPQHEEKKFSEKFEKILFGYIIFGEHFSRKNVAPQYPLASARGTQRSLNAPIGPQHEEKRFSEKFRKNTFRIYYFWRKFFA